MKTGDPVPSKKLHPLPKNPGGSSGTEKGKPPGKNNSHERKLKRIRVETTGRGNQVSVKNLGEKKRRGQRTLKRPWKKKQPKKDPIKKKREKHSRERNEATSGKEKGKNARGPAAQENFFNVED